MASASPHQQASPESPIGDSPATNNSAETRNTDKDAQATAEKRVRLACHRCRAKRARCSGDRPICRACEKANEECTWPSGRKRKRTRREMEAEERREREVASASSMVDHAFFAPPKPAHEQSSIWNLPHPASQQHPLHNGGVPPLGGDHSWQFATPLPQSTYVWPPSHPQGSDHASPVGMFNDTPSPDHQRTEQIVRALESQYAFIDGDPSRNEELELYYYRLSGSTAIHPGINRISLKLQPRQQSTAPAPVTDSASTYSTPTHPFSSTTLPHSPQLPPPPQDMFDSTGLPLPHIYLPLLDTFFRTMGCHFPSIRRKRMEERLETGTMSAFLLNCICAMSARFYPPAGTDSPTKACAPFITKAQELIIPLLHLPTTDSVTGLLLLAWANFGQNSESGLWQYSGMAIRMALDLGLHEITELYESWAHVVRVRTLFWSLFVTDRILSFSTGRPVSISEDIIEIPLPTDEDLGPDPIPDSDPTRNNANDLGRAHDPARNNNAAAAHMNGSSAHQDSAPKPFPHLVKLMVLCGRIANALNGRRGRSRTLVGPSVNAGVLGDLQGQLVQFYADLPVGMKWSVDAFQQQEARGYGGVFLTLHLWANAVLALVYHPELLTNPSGVETPMSSNMDRSVKLSLASSRTISECLVFADLFASHSYLASPMAVQPIFVACLAFIYDIKLSMLGIPSNQQRDGQDGASASRDDDSTSRNGDFAPTSRNVDLLLTSLARQNLSSMHRAIQRMEHYWAGISYVSSVLDQKAQGLIEFSPQMSTQKKTFISLPDTGLVRRFTGTHLPHNTAAPTETSLRESMAKEQSMNNTCSLDDIFNSYSVGGMFVQPADSFDLESLLSSSGMSMKVP
ncbi:fungal-specific transcription factor domain-containing protein [Schizophyllum amplum]|uniref:Fungal-specific transcription factor domain-containing protein n=1 Tax=Schizophyllum amplum TaxID=97359 RepID=A0A550CPJ0_9AGAR|nr:fungal-specific transcription factor domain-containing protein [Auriculariopsis ampla]